MAPVLRCHKCQQFGHVEGKCNGRLRCVRCGEGHEFKDCKKETRKCARCGGPHSAAYKGCQQYKIQKEKIKVKTFTKFSYAEAAKQVKTSMNDQNTKKNEETDKKQLTKPNQSDLPAKNTTERTNTTTTPTFRSKIPTTSNKKKTFAQIHVPKVPTLTREIAKEINETNPSHTQQNIIQAFVGISNSMVSFLAFIIKALQLTSQNPLKHSNQNTIDVVLTLSRVCLGLDIDKEQLENKLREVELPTS